MTFTAKQRFSVTGDLLYPAALGAGIAWWMEALVHWHAHKGAAPAAGWALIFGAFFIFYHSRSFIVLRDEETHREDARRVDTASPAGKYPWQEFIKDVTDCAALVLAFVSLRLADGGIECVDPVGVFVVAGLIPLAALITQASLKPKPENWSWPLRMGSLGIAVVGAGYAYADPRPLFVPSGADWCFLILLLLLLVVYLFWPQHFGVRTANERATPIASFGSKEGGIRAIVAVIALVSVGFYVWVRITTDSP